MDRRTTFVQAQTLQAVRQKTAYSILLTISFAHMLNDMMQSVIPAIYPLIKDKFGFNFAQIGIITLVFQLTSSICNLLLGIMPTVILSHIHCQPEWDVHY